MPAFCGQCGGVVPAGSAFCPHCGTATAPVTEAASPAPSPPPPPPPLPPSLPPGGSPQGGSAPGGSAQGTTTGISRSRWLLPVIGGLVLALVAGGLTVWLLGRDSDRDNPRAGRGDALQVRTASIDRGLSILSEAGRTWDYTADEVVEGGTFVPIDPHSDDELFSPTAVSVGDVLVTAVSSSSDEEQQTTLAGLGSDGEVRWRSDEVGDGCWAFEDRYLVCGAWSEGLFLVDPDTGRSLGSSDDATAWGVAPIVDRGVLYLVARDDHRPTAVVAIDLSTFRPLWRTEVTLASEEYGEIYGALSVTDERLTLTYSDTESSGIHLRGFDLRTGEQRSSESSEQEINHTGPWTVTRDYDPTFIQIAAAGDVVFERYGDPWWSPTGLTVVDGRAGVDATLYDVQSGDVVWSRDDLDGDDTTSWSWTADGEQVLVDSSYDGGVTSVLDADDGTLDWTYPSWLSPAVATDNAFVVTPRSDDGESWRIEVIDRATGEVAWTADVADLRPPEDEWGGESLGLYRTDTALWAIGPEGVRAFSDFPSDGSSTVDAVDAADGTGDGSNSDDDSMAYRTACGSPPEFRAVESRNDFGGVTISYRLTATCPGGQWLNHSQLSVPFVVDGQVYAGGYFDFSTAPYWVPDGDGDDLVLPLVYPYRNLEVPAGAIAQAIDDDAGTGTVVTVPCEPGPDNVGGAVPASPAGSADPDEATTADGVPDQESEDDRAAAAEVTLRRIADEDLTTVEALEWTNQLSAKKPGTVDDGMVYTADDILALHLEYRSRYPDSLLAWTGDWPGSYGPSFRDYWVTLSGRNDTATAPLLQWCRSEGWGDGDCWAKRLLASGNPQKESRHRDTWPPDPAHN